VYVPVGIVPPAIVLPREFPVSSILEFPDQMLAKNLYGAPRPNDCEKSFHQRMTKVVEVYYESIKREPKIRGIKKCRCDERLQTKTKEFTRLPYTGLVLELEYLKIETRLISERFANAMGECEN
jgi:hypothetical protein